MSNTNHLIFDFFLQTGLDPLLPIYQRGILYGSPTIREVAASGLGEVLKITASKFLAGPLIVKLTGPLLRVVGDRNPSSVKVAILKTLGLILTKGGPALRAFAPQFQTTFVKALSDPSRQVRVEAIAALSLLMPLSTRVDPLIKELVAGSLGNSVAVEGVGAVAVQTATLEALTTVLEKGGKKAKLPASIPSALDAAKQLLQNEDQGIREGAASVMGVACSLLGPEITQELIEETIMGTDDQSLEGLHGRLSGIRRILVSCEEMSDDAPRLSKFALENTNNVSTEPLVREAAFVALGTAIGRSNDPKSALRSSQKGFISVIENSKESIEIHRAVALGLISAVQMQDAPDRVDFLGLQLLDACVKIALSGSQRVQFAFNDLLWLAFDVANGEVGLNEYCGMTVFDNQKSAKSLFSKVLIKIKEIKTV